MDYDYNRLKKCIFCGKDAYEIDKSPPRFLPVEANLIPYKWCKVHKDRILREDDLKNLPQPYLD